MTVRLLGGIGPLFTAAGSVRTHGALVLTGPYRVGGDDAAAPPPRARLPRRAVEDVNVALVTPGPVDAHNHRVSAGQRFAGIAARTESLSYRNLGLDAGIGATVRAARRWATTS